MLRLSIHRVDRSGALLGAPESNHVSAQVLFFLFFLYFFVRSSSLGPPVSILFLFQTQDVPSCPSCLAAHPTDPGKADIINIIIYIILIIILFTVIPFSSSSFSSSGQIAVGCHSGEVAVYRLLKIMMMTIIFVINIKMMTMNNKIIIKITRVDREVDHIPHKHEDDHRDQDDHIDNQS